MNQTHFRSGTDKMLGLPFLPPPKNRRASFYIGKCNPNFSPIASNTRRSASLPILFFSWVTRKVAGLLLLAGYPSACKRISPHHLCHLPPSYSEAYELWKM